MLANASGLRWIAPDRILFSEIKAGVHMALVTSQESRTGQRDVYVPPHARGMAHRSAISPDGKWVLVVEMDNSGWLPCRLVPFDGGGATRQVGPLNGSCIEAAWSPDGKWMYFTSDASGGAHIWRQRFAGGAPEPLTSGATREAGIAVAPDGRSLITSSGQEQSELWYHDRNGERQLTSQGFAANPQLSGDGSRVFYVTQTGENAARVGFVAGEPWVVESGDGAEGAPAAGSGGQRVRRSPDGKRIVYSIDVGAGAEIWLAPTDGRTPPRRLATGRIMYPRFGGGDRIYFAKAENNENYLYRMNLDGTEQVRPWSVPSWR